MAETGNMDRYAQRGVSSQKEDVHRAIRNTDKGLFPGAFCKIVEDVYSAEQDPWCSVMHADGAGTKSSLAYAYWKETSDLSVWDGIAQDAIVMNTDDLLCVGITDDIYISSTIGRNKNLVPAQVIERLIAGSQRFVSKMAEYGVRLIPTGGETADVGDLVRTVIADTTVYAKIRRSQVIDNSRIKSGDVIVGLASDGQARYEDFYNGGMGSNGLTSARHDVFAKYLGVRYPETYDPSMPESLVYSGSKKLTDIEPQTGMTYGKLVLSPTRTYAPVAKRVLDRMRSSIHGMIHCSGGGQTKVLHFAPGLRIVKDNLFDVPVLFRTIQAQSQTPWREMFKVFNMGHRMEFYVSESYAQDIIDIAEALGVGARVVGRVEKLSGSLPQLTIRCPMGEFDY